MKQKSCLLALCLALALTLTACGGIQTTQSEDESGSAAPDASAFAEAEPVEEADESQTAEVDSSVSTNAAASISLETVKGTVVADDGTLLVEYSYQVPTVTLADATAQAKVQEDLDAEAEGFATYVQDTMPQYAREDYQNYYVDSSFAFNNYSDEMTITLARVDDAVISLVIDAVGYSGGPHGWDYRYCRNYGAQTGEMLTFAMLGEDFRSAAEALVLAKADEMQAEGAVFFNYNYADCISEVVCDGTEIEGDFSSTYYLTDEGITFISGQYIMQSYAEGIIEFFFSYDDFIDVMNSQYML
ncbi:MAG: DUF3298 and DUF4163 domain-containing protein [Clostridiales bacterium]|nr:DUF3298 and DUF4163 domain-containing protein [Clostridiales bacterium]